MQLEWLIEKMKAAYGMKSQILGPDKGEERQVEILNRIITWGDKEITYEPDPRHAKMIVKDLGLSDAKSVKTPGVRLPSQTTEEGEEVREKTRG